MLVFMAQIIEVSADDVAATKFLESYIQSGNLNFLIGSGASSPAIKVAGTIEAEINDLIVAGNEAQADARCIEFIEQINKAQSALASATDPVTKKVAENYGDFISCIDQILFARKNILIPRQANLFTTNYDMFIEYAASLLPSVILNDGFDRSPGLGTDFVFAPERYFDRTYRSGSLHTHQIEIPTINLIKLHGSLSWRRTKDALLFNPVPVKALTAAERANPAKVKEFLAKHFLILPNLRKFHETLIERIYYDLLRLFSKAMDQQNVVILAFGFSFADEHILDLTKRSLRNPTAQLIIFSYDKVSAAGYSGKFAKQRNVSILAPESGANIDLSRLNKILFSTISGQTNAT
ncbi:SIR2 family protein [Bradyrhizobium sp. AZCC 2230]|uniref:SIR2 family protein n=1 Tax=Bradyrhizobium sp. AZCC 2230 TaxID=3117021 RepID=UPI002FF0A029